MILLSLTNFVSEKKKTSEPKSPKPEPNLQPISPENKDEEEDSDIETKSTPFEKFCKEHAEFDELTNRIYYYILHYRSVFPVSCWTISVRLNLLEAKISEICERLTALKLVSKVISNGHIAYERIVQKK